MGIKDTNLPSVVEKSKFKSIVSPPAFIIRSSPSTDSTAAGLIIPQYIFIYLFNPHISGPTQFKPMWFKGQLYR